MRYKLLFILIVCIIIATSIAGCITNDNKNKVGKNGEYNMSITKNANSSIEKKALEISENIDYSSIYLVKRYYHSTQGIDGFEGYSNNMSFT